MKNLRKYGDAPFKVAALHGGPGAPGAVAAVAQELSKDFGTLEPLQTADSVEGQIQELKTVLMENADAPAILVGSSWGAMLGFLFAARFPELVKKLIMVGSGTFEEEYAKNIMPTRLARLSVTEKLELDAVMEKMKNAQGPEKNQIMQRFGKLCSKADDFNPVPDENNDVIECQYDLHVKVWGEAHQMRIDGKFLNAGKQVKCPVVAFHGDYDPTPADGIEVPLKRIVKDFKFILLERCGHSPWKEIHAKDKFYQLLRDELQN